MQSWKKNVVAKQVATFYERVNINMKHSFLMSALLESKYLFNFSPISAQFVIVKFGIAHL